jgi:adenine-specific DNA-methyltransferase
VSGRKWIGAPDPIKAKVAYPKSLWTVVDGLWAITFGEEDSLVLDYFGGSGTTGHAVLALNRADGGSRKYILVEMGEYFDTVLKPRLQKAVLSESWEGGAPSRQTHPKDPSNIYNGVSHCLKVLRLESYEDALDNIEFNSAAAPGAELGLDFRRDYELRYALDWESKNCPTRLALEQLDMPFDYTLTLRRETGTVAVKPDLPETFAYLIGLHTRRRFRIERNTVSYLIYTGTLHEDGTEVAVLWRTCKDWKEANLKAEMEWWREERETLAPGATRIYVNGASAIEGHRSLDAEMKSRMHGGNG